MKKLGWLLYITFFSVSAANAQDSYKGDPEAGKAKNAICAACHGVDGNSALDINPKIAGQHANYLYKQLSEFKLASQTGGKEGRNNAVMNGMAAALSEEDMKDLAAYFSSQDMKAGETPEEYVLPGGVVVSRW